MYELKRKSHVRKGLKKRMALLLFTILVLNLTGCGTEKEPTVYTLEPEKLQNTQKELSEQAETEAEEAQPEEPPPETPPTEIEPEIVTITISAAGDVTLGNMHLQDYWGTFRQMYDNQTPQYFLENVKPIFEADDMTIVNFEGVLTFTDERVEKEYNMKGDPEYAFILPEGSVEAVSLGNNHHMDYGQAGHDDTVEALENAGIVYACDAQTGIYCTKGINIGFVSVNQVYDGAAVEKYLEEGLEALKEQGADLLIACCHWGTELQHDIDPYQQELGRKCIDWGADLVLGHHPHVLQGIEEYHGKYIVYSLGNFCFGGNRNPKDKDTMIFQQTFTFADGVKEEDNNIRIIPCFVSSVKSRNDYKPTPAEGEEAERIINLVNEYSKPFGTEFDKDGALIQG